MENKTHL